MGEVYEHQPDSIPLLHPSDKLIYLAGPVLGTSNWQKKAVKSFKRHYYGKAAEAHIANPRQEVRQPDSASYESADKQFLWQKHHLQRAASNGAILLWFARHDNNESNTENGSLEFGRILGWKEYDHSLKFHLGIEPGYEGSDIEYTQLCAKEFNIPIRTCLEELTEDTYIDLRRNR